MKKLIFPRCHTNVYIEGVNNCPDTFIHSYNYSTNKAGIVKHVFIESKTSALSQLSTLVLPLVLIFGDIISKATRESQTKVIQKFRSSSI